MVRRLLPLAAATAVVVVATSVGLARHRARSPRRDAWPDTSGMRTTSPLRPPEDAVLPTVPVTHHDRPRSAASLGPVAIAVALLLSGIGAGFVGVAVASQRRAPEPPTTAAQPEVAPSRPVEGWKARSAPPIADAPTPQGPARQPTSVDSAVVLPRSRPVLLHIPAIGVRSVVRDVGQAADGTLETPRPGPHYNDAAWYRHSPTPGSLGPSILLGHVDSAAEGPSVFFRLGDLAVGDRVAVTRADTSVAVFRVEVVRRYAKDDFPTDQVYGDLDHAALRIVTCGGAFDNSSGHYLDNVVVFAALVGRS